MRYFQGIGPQVLNLAPEYRVVFADRYPPPGVWRQVDDAAQIAEALDRAGYEIDFRVDESGRVAIGLLEAGEPVRSLSVLEALAVAAGGPV
jgi:hypothetical protein